MSNLRLVAHIVNTICYSYDIWGNPIKETESVNNLFRYSGEYWDKTTSLQYLRARWYDPDMGRFLNEDTYDGDINNPTSLNLYTYVGSNPLTLVDPSGHQIYAIGSNKNGYTLIFSDRLIENVRAAYGFFPWIGSYLTDAVD
nr:RHS repeat-associated core domain-containing protein [Gorillibacterium timonense]